MLLAESVSVARPEYGWLISRAIRLPVSGIICMTPIAPALERISRMNRLSLRAMPDVNQLDARVWIESIPAELDPDARKVRMDQIAE